MIEDIVIKESNWSWRDIQVLFTKNDSESLPTVYFANAKTLEDLMLEMGAYKSKGEARRAHRVGVIPAGWTEMWANKKNKIWIWNP